MPFKPFLVKFRHEWSFVGSFSIIFGEQQSISEPSELLWQVVLQSSVHRIFTPLGNIIQPWSGFNTQEPERLTSAAAVSLETAQDVVAKEYSDPCCLLWLSPWRSVFLFSESGIMFPNSSYSTDWPYSFISCCIRAFSSAGLEKKEVFPF